MGILKRNWEKLAFVAALALLALAGYRLYLDTRLSSENERVSSIVSDVQKQLERKPAKSVSEPAFSETLQKRWSPPEQVPEGKRYLFHMPPLVRPILDLRPEERCVIPGISQLQGNGSVGHVSLKWKFEQVPDKEGVTAVSPGSVEIQRRKQGTNSWTVVTSFSGKDESSYTDSGVESRTSYEYRLMVKRGDKTCDVEGGSFVKEQKTSQVISVDVKSDVELVLKSTSDTSALIEVMKYQAGESEPKKKGFWHDEGDRIGKGQFQTPYTLTAVVNDAKFSYYTLTEDHVIDKKQGNLVRVGVIKKRVVDRPRIEYEDKKGNTYKKWRKQNVEYANRITPPPPWQKPELRNKFDGRFRTELDRIWETPVPEKYRVKNIEEETSDGEGSTDGEQEAESDGNQSDGEEQ